ncbi:MAG: TVP38/TMEM64 family protein [Synechococcus sp.]
MALHLHNRGETKDTERSRSNRLTPTPAKADKTGLQEVFRFLLQQCMRPRLWIAIAVLTLLALLFFTPLGERLQHEQLVMDLEMLGTWAPALFIAMNIVAASLGVPGTVLTVAGGAVFGLAWGTVWSTIGSTLGAIGAFVLARYLLHDWAVQRYGHHPLLQRLNRSIKQHSLKLMLAVRLFPISPFNLVNFLLGLTKVSLSDYSLGTAVGIIPGTVLYTWIGVSGRELVEGGDSFPFGMAIAALTLLSVLPILAKRWYK